MVSGEGLKLIFQRSCSNTMHVVIPYPTDLDGKLGISGHFHSTSTVLCYTRPDKIWSTSGTVYRCTQRNKQKESRISNTQMRPGALQDPSVSFNRVNFAQPNHNGNPQLCLPKFCGSVLQWDLT